MTPTESRVSATHRLMQAVSALHTIGLDITAQSDIPGVLRRITKYAVDLLDADAGGAIYLYDPVRGSLVLTAAIGDTEQLVGTVMRPGEGLGGRVFATGEAMAIDDYGKWEGRSTRFDPSAYRAVMCVPLRWQDEVIGTLNVATNATGRTFGADDMQVAELFAGQAAIAIGNVRLLESVQRRIGQLDTLRTILLEMLSATEPYKILRLIARAALEHTLAQDVHLYLYDSETGSLSFGTSLWADGTEDQEYSAPRPDGITMTVARTGKRVLVVDPRHDPMFAGANDTDEALTAFVSIPFKQGGEVLGVFNIAFDKQTVLDRSLLNFLDLLAAQAAVALFNTRLLQSAERRAEEFDRLRKVAVEILSSKDVSTILRRIGEEAREHCGAEDVRIYLYDQTNDRLTYATSLRQEGGDEVYPPRPDGLTATVARTGERILITDPHTHPLYTDFIHREEWRFHTLVGVPLKRGDEVIGVLNGIFSNSVRQDTLRFLDLLAAQAAVAIQNARLFEAVEQRADEYARLRAAALELLSANDVQAMMRAIARAAVEGAKAQDAHIYLYDEVSDTLSPGAILWAEQGKHDFEHEFVVPRPDGFTATVARSGERMMIVNPANHPLFADIVADREWQFHTIVGVPLKQGAHVRGVMNVMFEARVGEEVLSFLDLLAAQAVVGLQNAQLYEAEHAERARADAVLNAALTLSSTLSIGDLLQQILEESARVLHFTTGSIMIYDEGVPSIVAMSGYEGREGQIINMFHDKLRSSPLHQRIIQDQKPIILPDVSKEPDWVYVPETGHIRCWMGVPLVVRGQVLGVLSLDSDQIDTFNAHQAAIAQGLAAHAAIAIENARLFNSTAETLNQIEAFFSASRSLITAREPEDLLRAVAGPALAVGGCNAMLLYAHLDAQGRPVTAEVVACTREADGPMIPEPGARFNLRDLPIGRQLRRAPSQIVTIPEMDPNRTNSRLTRSLLETAGSRATAFIPLMLGDRLVGLLNLHWSEPHHFDPREVQFYQVLSPQLAAVVENRRLFEETRQAQERFRDIALSTSDWVWETDSRGRVTYCTERIFDSLGYTADEFIGHTAYEFMPPDEAERVRQVINDHALRREAIESLEYTNIHRDGRRIELSTSAVPILDARRGVIGFRGVTKDITEQRRAEQREQLAYEIGQHMTGVLSLEDLATAVVTQLREVFGYYYALLALYEEDTGLLRARKSAGEADMPIPYEERKIRIDHQPSLLTKAARSRTPVISNDTINDPDFLANPFLAYTRSEASFPLIRGDRLIGVLDVQAREVGHFVPAEVRALENLAAHLSIAIENASLYEAERAARTRADALREASRVLSSTLSLEEVLQSILRQCGEVVPYTTSSILIYKNDQPILVASAGSPELVDIQETKVAPVLANGVLIRRIIDTRQPVIVPSIADEPAWIPYPGEEDLLCWMGVPMIARDSLVGILMLYSDRPAAYGPDELEFVQGLAAHAALAIENARLYQAVARQASDLEELVAERTADVVHEQERMRAIVDSAGEAIIFTDPEGIIQFTNSAWDRLTGLPSEHVHGKSASLFMGTATPEMYQGIVATMEAGRIWEGEIHARRPDGSEYDAAVTIAPVLDKATGKLVNVVGIFRDVSAQKEVERMRRVFVTNISHELRTPITGLKLFHSLLRAGAVESREEYMDTMAGELSRLERLIEDLLDISRLDQGVLSMRPETLDVNQLVRDVQRTLRLRAEERGLQLELELDEALLPIFGDRERVMQVLINLLTNAINYTNPGDRLGVRTFLSMERGEPVAAMSVWDTGMGIAPDDLPFIFNRFYRAETAKVEGIPGTGLGLSIVKEIVEMHRGYVTVESALGIGTTFTVHIPTVQPGKELQSEPIAEPRNPL